MVPVIVHQIGHWLDRFTETLTLWEQLLCDLRSAYFREDDREVERLYGGVDRACVRMLEDKLERARILEQASQQGRPAVTLGELSRLLDAQWPALWTHRLMSMESQISRIQQLGVSLWIHAEPSRDRISGMMKLLGSNKQPQEIVEEVSQASLTTSVLEHELEDDLESVILPFARRAS
jgi:hypothetical protein